MTGYAAFRFRPTDPSEREPPTTEPGKAKLEETAELRRENETQRDRLSAERGQSPYRWQP